MFSRKTRPPANPVPLFADEEVSRATQAPASKPMVPAPGPGQTAAKAVPVDRFNIPPVVRPPAATALASLPTPAPPPSVVAAPAPMRVPAPPAPQEVASATVDPVTQHATHQGLAVYRSAPENQRVAADPAPAAGPQARLATMVAPAPAGCVADTFEGQLEEMVNCLFEPGQFIEQGLDLNPRWLLSVKVVRGEERGCRRFRLCSPVRVVANEGRPELSTWRALAYPVTRVTNVQLGEPVELEGLLAPPWPSRDTSAFGGNGPGLEGLLDAVDALESRRARAGTRLADAA